MKTIKHPVPMTTATKCLNYKRYKADNPPKCGCDMCAMKFQLETLRKAQWQDSWI